MNTFSQMRRKGARQLFRQRGEFNVKPLACILAALFALPVAQADVDIARSPAMLGGNQPPNVMILLDNSFSMGSGHLPTNSAYYGPTTGGDTDVDGYTRPKYGNLAVRSFYVNKLAYNPVQKYDPPLKADGTPWPNVDFYNAPRDGFGAAIPDATRATVDLSHDYRDRGYGGILHFNRSQPDNDGNCTVPHGVPGSTDFAGSHTTGVGSGNNYCGHTFNDPASRSAYYTWFNPSRDPNPVTGCKYTTDDGVEIIKQDPLSNTIAKPIVTLTGKNKSTNADEGYPGRSPAAPDNGSENGAYNFRFQKCFEIVQVGSPRDLALTGMSEAEAKQNFANWYSYYSTRINLLKSAVSQALQGVNSTARIGFGVTGAGEGSTTTTQAENCNTTPSYATGTRCYLGRAFKSLAEYSNGYLNMPSPKVYYGGSYQHPVDGLVSLSDSKGFYSIQRGVRPFRDIGDESSMPIDYQNQPFKSQVFDYLFSMVPASIGDALENLTHSDPKTSYSKDAKMDQLAALRRALGEAGEYYRLKDAKGPWSLYPGVSETDPKQKIQACRKSYTVLVTTGQYEQGRNQSRPVNECARGDQDGTFGTSFGNTSGCDASGIRTANAGFWSSNTSQIMPAPGVAASPFLYDPIGVPFTDEAGSCSTRSTTVDGHTVSAKYNCGNADTLADVAMAYWKNDLLPDDSRPLDDPARNPAYDNNVPFGMGKDPDIAFWQHMNTIVLQMGETHGVDAERVAKGAVCALSNALDPSNCGASDPDRLPANWGYGGGNRWGDPIGTSIGTNSVSDEQKTNDHYGAHPVNVTRVQLFGNDMVHAAVNSGGAYFSINSPSELTKAINEAVNALAMDDVTFTTAPTNSGSPNPPMIYVPVFNSSDWTGTIRAYRLCTGYEVLQDKDPASSTYRAERNCQNEDDRWQTPAWDAAQIRGANSLSGSYAGVYSWDPLASDGVNFSWTGTGHISDEQKTKLGSDEDVLKYLIGDRSNEEQNGGGFRDRVTEWFLGDIVNSAPVFVGNDDFGFATAGAIPMSWRNEYRARKNSNSPRKEVLYVGANDGMLHAFDANSKVDASTLVGEGGAELFSYVPNNVIEHLKELSEPSYGHRYYVDGSPTVGDARLSGGWKTVLVGSTGAGGKAYFALDVENPSDFQAGNVLWEVSNETEGFTNLGTAIGKASIALLNYGGDKKWVAIFGNGYNSDGHTARLYIAELDSGAILEDIDTDVGGATNSNGLASPLVIDENGDGVAETAYAGDLQGNLWAVDLRDGSAMTPRKILIAKDGEGNPQPITSKPEAVRHPLGGLMVYVGTGKIFGSSDKADTSVQTFYGVHDPCGGNAAGSCSFSAASRGTLLPQKMDIGDQHLEYSTPVRSVSQYTYADPNNQPGFYLDLIVGTEKKGERMVAPPLVLNDRLIFNTLEPGTENECAALGEGWVYQLDPFTGGRTQFVAFDLNSNGLYDDPNVSAIRAGMNGGGVTWGTRGLFVGGKKATDLTRGSTEGIGTGRKFWLQVR
jgi:type IV pilus assembly protein PilY1